MSKKGNLLASLPKNIQEFIKYNTNNSSKQINEGIYVVHRQMLYLPNGTQISMKLSVEIELSHETKITRKSGKTVITEITQFYKKIFCYRTFYLFKLKLKNINIYLFVLN